MKNKIKRTTLKSAYDKIHDPVTLLEFVKQLRKDIGDIDDLTTEERNNLVDAINYTLRVAQGGGIPLVSTEYIEIFTRTGVEGQFIGIKDDHIENEEAQEESIKLVTSNLLYKEGEAIISGLESIFEEIENELSSLDGRVETLEDSVSDLDTYKANKEVEVVLWENDDPTIAFSDSTVNVNNLSQYRKIKIYYIANLTNNDTSIDTVINRLNEKPFTDKVVFDSDVENLYYRKVGLSYDENIAHFENCFYLTTNAVSNDRLIPIKIIGIKEVTPPVKKKLKSKAKKSFLSSIKDLIKKAVKNVK